MCQLLPKFRRTGNKTASQPQDENNNQPFFSLSVAIFEPSSTTEISSCSTLVGAPSMTRSIPSPLHESNPASLHPLLALSFLALSIVASLAVISTLCASFHRKSSPEKPNPNHPPSPRQRSNRSSEAKPEEEAAAAAAETPFDEEYQSQQKSQIAADEKVVLDVATHGPILPVATVEQTTTTRRRLSMSLSMKFPEGLSKIRTSRKERGGKSAAKGEAVGEETIWKKTIILGEKCQVPSSEEGDGDEASGRGKVSWQRNYHPRTPRSLPVSRTNSFTNSEQFFLPPPP